MENDAQRIVLEMQGIGVERRGTWLLDEITWKVQRGEHWAVVGANGSGKTSLLHVLLSYLPATRGQFSVLGKRHGSFDWRLLRQRIGVVSPALPSMMDPTEPGINVVYSGKAAQIGHFGPTNPQDVERASQLLHEIGADYLEQRPWRVLSQGERQRLLIARALMADPELLILDEPCSGLDPAAREGFLEFIDRVQARADGPCLVLVTHHLEEIMPRFSHVLVMRRGRVAAQGPKQEVLTSEVLTQAFARDAVVRVANRRYSLSFARAEGSIV